MGYPDFQEQIQRAKEAVLIGTETTAVLLEVRDERAAQDRKWGQQDWPVGNSACDFNAKRERAAKAIVDARLKNKTVNWIEIIREEIAEIENSADLAAARVELIQTAASAVAAIEALDRRVAKGEI